MIRMPPMPGVASDRRSFCLVFSAKSNGAENTRSYKVKFKVKVMFGNS